jgi:undecaprenyl-diphosphatase
VHTPVHHQRGGVSFCGTRSKGFALQSGWSQPIDYWKLAFVRYLATVNSFPIVLHRSSPEIETDKPPLLPSWRAWYWLVLGALALEIGLFVYLTRAFA